MGYISGSLTKTAAYLMMTFGLSTIFWGRLFLEFLNSLWFYIPSIWFKEQKSPGSYTIIVTCFFSNKKSLKSHFNKKEDINILNKVKFSPTRMRAIVLLTSM